MTAYALAGLIILGAALIAIGGALLVRGLLVRRQVVLALEEEHATTPSGAGGSGEPASPSEPIRDARTAQVRADEIKKHTIEEVGYFQQTKPDSTERAWFLQGLTIRNSLSMAIMAFGVANLAMGMGGALVLMGTAVIALGVPVVLSLDL